MFPLFCGRLHKETSPLSFHFLTRHITPRFLLPPYCDAPSLSAPPFVTKPLQLCAVEGLLHHLASSQTLRVIPPLPPFHPFDLIKRRILPRISELHAYPLTPPPDVEDFIVVFSLSFFNRDILPPGRPSKKVASFPENH